MKLSYQFVTNGVIRVRYSFRPVTKKRRIVLRSGKVIVLD